MEHRVHHDLADDRAERAEGALVFSSDKSADEPTGLCQRPRRGLAFQRPDGSLASVPCNSPNKCDGCRFMTTVLWAAMVLQDARDHAPPTHGLTLTTQREHTAPKTFRDDVAAVRRFLRGEVGPYEDCVHIEYTQGTTRQSGGVRRIHAHALCKFPDGLAEADRAKLERGVRDLWKARTGAHRVTLEALRTAAAAAHYLTHHHGKRAQLPPRDWTGRRFRPTRGYFALPRAERIRQARSHLQDEGLKRRVRALLLADAQLLDVDADVWDDLLERDLARAREVAAQGVQLVRIQRVPTEFGDDGLPAAWSTQVMGPADEAWRE